MAVSHGSGPTSPTNCVGPSERSAAGGPTFPVLQRFVYGRRRSQRLRPGRRRLLAERLPQVELTVPQSGRINTATLFGDQRPLWLEIGFGGGEHLAQQAAAHPDRGLIGCEPYISGVARLLALAEAQALTNLRIVVDDARLLLDALPDGCLERIFVLFPDPWPKARHHKRRIVNPATAAQFARLLRPGGELRLATDDMGYVRAMLLALLPLREFAWLARGPADWRARVPDWPPTRYEDKAQKAGRPCVYLRFRRLPDL
jgi:tRNA (guanine-N7-)-methyltransferase